MIRFGVIWIVTIGLAINTLAVPNPTAPSHLQRLPNLDPENASKFDKFLAIPPGHGSGTSTSFDVLSFYTNMAAALTAEKQINLFKENLPQLRDLSRSCGGERPWFSIKMKGEPYEGPIMRQNHAYERLRTMIQLPRNITAEGTFKEKDTSSPSGKFSVNLKRSTTGDPYKCTPLEWPKVKDRLKELSERSEGLKILSTIKTLEQWRALVDKIRQASINEAFKEADTLTLDPAVKKQLADLCDWFADLFASLDALEAMVHCPVSPAPTNFKIMITTVDQSFGPYTWTNETHNEINDSFNKTFNKTIIYPEKKCKPLDCKKKRPFKLELLVGFSFVEEQNYQLSEREGGGYVIEPGSKEAAEFTGGLGFAVPLPAPEGSLLDDRWNLTLGVLYSRHDFGGFIGLSWVNESFGAVFGLHIQRIDVLQNDLAAGSVIDDRSDLRFESEYEPGLFLGLAFEWN